MGDASSIEWTDATWNPIRGCSRVSAGCEHCYAEGVARRFSGPGQPYEGLVRLDAAGKPKAQWNGTVRVVPEHLADPLRWRRPRRVFVNSMSDLFHENLPLRDVASIFAVMACASDHVFQVLTKRAQRMATLLASDLFWYDVEIAVGSLRAAGIDASSDVQQQRCDEAIERRELPNVWLGVSVEDQASAEQRIPLLLSVSAALLWVSYEPAIGPVRFDRVESEDGDTWVNALTGRWSGNDTPVGRLGWVVVGGESGPGARPFDLEWARSTVRACAPAGVPCFVKQLGSARRVHAHEYDPGCLIIIRHPKGGDPSEWPEDLRVREWPGVRP